MKSSSLLSCLCTSILLFSTQNVGAQNLLASGGFEPSGGEINGWNLQQFATGSGAILDTAELVNFAPNSGVRELWLKAFAGGNAPGPNNLTNAILSQKVSALPGEAYTFGGYSRWEASYSGGVTTLNASSPLGAVASPTATTMRLDFLNVGDSIIGSTVLDLRTEQSNTNLWKAHSLNGIAPVGTANVRVTAEARDMVFNGGAQSAFYDNFSLTRASSPATQLLTNPDLELPPATGLDPWTVTQNDPAGPNDEIVRLVGFANRPGNGGTSGIWLSSFFGEPGSEVDGLVSQTVPAQAGIGYQFSGWSFWETNYSGGLAGPTDTLMEMAFLDVNGDEIGTPKVLDLRGVQANDNVWREHILNGRAPAGTASVRVTAGMFDGFGTSGAQSAFFDDFALVAVPEPGTFLLVSMAIAHAMVYRRRPSV